MINEGNFVEREVGLALFEIFTNKSNLKDENHEFHGDESTGFKKLTEACFQRFDEPQYEDVAFFDILQSFGYFVMSTLDHGGLIYFLDVVSNLERNRIQITRKAGRVCQRCLFCEAALEFRSIYFDPESR